MRCARAPSVLVLALATVFAASAWAEEEAPADPAEAPSSSSDVVSAEGATPALPATPADPADPADPAEADDAAPADAAPDEGTPDAPSSAEAALETCRSMLRNADTRGRAARCFHDANARGELDDRRASAFAAFATSARASDADLGDEALGGGDLPVVEEVVEPVEESVASRVWKSGVPELTLSGTVYGGMAGFLGMSSVLAATRVDSSTAWPLLLASPAVGAVAGLALSGTSSWLTAPSAGDAALISSSTWWGTVYGIPLQTLMFHEAEPISVMPWRFATVLGSGLTAGAVALGTSFLVDVEPGDVGVANSAAFWTGVMALFAFTGFAPSSLLFSGSEPHATMLSLTLPSLGAYVGALSLSPLLSVARPYTWLIEAGGIAGLLTFGMVTTVGSAAYTLPGDLSRNVIGATGMAFVGVGTGAGLLGAVALSSLGAQNDMLEALTSKLSLAPMLLPPAPRVVTRDASTSMPVGVAVEAVF